MILVKQLVDESARLRLIFLLRNKFLLNRISDHFIEHVLIHDVLKLNRVF